jgi:hypothetical protein
MAEAFDKDSGANFSVLPIIRIYGSSSGKHVKSGRRLSFLARLTVGFHS